MRPIGLSMNCVTKLHANPMATRESFRERFRGPQAGALLCLQEILLQINFKETAFWCKCRLQNLEQILAPLLAWCDLSHARGT
jgi:hypothetical protein